ncbi:MAG: enoyl-CoA hydratase/carnithine racemase [Halioglobus sp.]|jgi:enoyl-CoA hydratase/carnithine racemase
MKYFDTINKELLNQQIFAFINVDEEDKVLTVTLDRAEKKNALHPQMINELAYAMQYAHSNKDIWVVLFQAKGDVFCAGADLKAMMGMGGEYNSSIPFPKKDILLGEIFHKIHKPTIAKIEGAVYAGGFFFLAGCHIVIAKSHVKLGLPEVKRGLFPFQVMASLMNVMPKRKVVDWCIRGYNLPVEDALQYGLVTEIVEADKVEEVTSKIIDELKFNSPTAIRNGLTALDHILPTGETHMYLMQMLLNTLGSKDGQEGLKAFKEKRKPNWTGE